MHRDHVRVGVLSWEISHLNVSTRVSSLRLPQSNLQCSLSAQQAVREILMETERCNGKAKAEEQGALTLILDLAKAFERVSLPVVWAWATHFNFPRKILRVL